MFHSSIRWVLSLNWVSQKWGQLHIQFMKAAAKAMDEKKR
jgi:hypothetical protein